MSLWTKLTGADSAQPATGRTPRENARRSAEIRRIDKGTDRWLRAGGWSSRKDR